ncbi:disulfide bond formation protein B [Ferrimonas kyonanensis]|uniref:disulfide bond formation protein B n=1 Tax=Ferrimonas kyonanensis TaxID=364763 RepID=UPI00042923DD|nr:disulfide bond formation protein B [Ferrimonas kyonanensis]
MNQIIQFFRDLFTNPTDLQDTRLPWWVMTGIAFSALVCASLYFQWWLEGEPCEQCVYIREAQFFILIAGALILVNPKQVGLKLAGLTGAWVGVIYGMVCSVKLAGIEKAMQKLNEGGDLFASGAGANACSLEPKFLTGLPLDQWWPTEFKPGGICGEFEWSLLGFGMADYCIVIFAAFGLCLAPLTYGFIKNIVKGKIGSAITS